MRTIYVLIGAGLVVTLALGETAQPTASQLEALERFARPGTTQVSWSKEVGRIDADPAQAVITALILESASQTPRRMRGIRIDLSDGKAKDQVYTGEEFLGRLIQALNQITDGLPQFLARGHSRGCYGSAIFWQQAGHAFSASLCAFPEWEGLSVETGAERFRFAGIRPALFAGAIARGRDELKAHE